MLYWAGSELIYQKQVQRVKHLLPLFQLLWSAHSCCAAASHFVTHLWGVDINPAKNSLSEKKITLFVSLQWVALIVELLWCSQTYIKTFQPILRLFSVLLIPNYTINPLASLIFLSLIGAAHLIPVNNYCLCDGIETYPAKGKLPELWWEYLSTTVLLVFTSLPSAPHNAERKSMPHIRVHFLSYGGKVM